MATAIASHDDKRGLKRKRGGENEEDVATKLRTKLHHGVKEVKKASKKVKTFETQKVVKKLKEAHKKDEIEAAKTLEDQLQVLKTVDQERIGVQALRSKIAKDPLLSRSEDCQAAVLNELPPVAKDLASSHPHRAIVESRLLSSKVLAQEIAGIVQGLRVLVGGQDKEGEASEVVSELAKSTKGKGKQMEMETIESNGGDTEDADNEDAEDETEAGGDSAWGGFGEVDADDSGGDEGEGWESGTVDGTDEDDDQPTDPDSSDSDDVDSPSHPEKPTKMAKSGESTFLPSLAVGYIRGDSDSDWSDGDANLADLPDRKNRRGQRARKAIWEKKYGKNANHIKKQKEAEKVETIAAAYGARTRGRGASRGSAAAASRGRGAAVPGRGRGGLDHDHGHYRSQIAPRPERFGMRHIRTQEGSGRSQQILQENKPLHPSWEAKRKLKEKQSAAIVPAQGTRIKFD